MVSKEELTRMRQDDSVRMEQQLSQYREQLNASYQTAYSNAVQQRQAAQPQAGADPRQQATSEMQALLAAADADNGGLVNTKIVGELIEKFNVALYAQQDRLDNHERAMRLVYGNQQQGATGLAQLQQQNAGANLQAKMGEIFATHGIPQESYGVAQRVVQNIYDAAQGQVDLDRDLPRLFEEQWLGLSKAFHGIHKAEGEKAKLVPGQGGQAAPSLPLSTSNLSERQLQDQAWQAIQDAPAQ